MLVSAVFIEDKSENLFSKIGNFSRDFNACVVKSKLWFFLRLVISSDSSELL